MLPAVLAGVTARGSPDPRPAAADSTSRRPWRVRAEGRTRLAAARTGASIVATAGLVLLAAACGGNPSSDGSGGSNAGQSTNSQQVAFAQCMRSSGVPNYPDPDSSGVIPKETSQQLGVTNSHLQSAQSSCQHLLPNDGSRPDEAALAQMRAQGLSFAQCMRNHGVALPDPGTAGRIPDPASLGIDQGSPQFEAANQVCGQYRPPYMPSNVAYNSYARTDGS